MPFFSRIRAFPRGVVVISVIGSMMFSVGAMAVVSYNVVRELILNNLEQQLLLQVRQSSHQIDEWLAIRKAEVETLARSPLTRSLDWAIAGRYLTDESQYLDEFFFIALAKTDGTAWTTRVGRLNPNNREVNSYAEAIAAETVVQDPTLNRRTGEVTIAVSAPIYADIYADNSSNPIGVLSGAIKTNRLMQVMRQLNESQGYAFILNSKGVAIAHPDSVTKTALEQHSTSLLDSNDANMAAIAQRMVNQEQGIQLIQIEGQWQYIAFVPLDEVNWSVALVTPREIIETRLRALNTLAAVISGLTLLAAIFTWRQMRVYEKTRNHAAQEALLNRLTTRIRDSLDLQTIVKTTVSELANLHVVDQVLFGWYSPKTQLFDVVVDSTALASSLSSNSFVVEDLGQRFLNQEALCLQSIHQHSRVTLQLLAHHYIALPVPTSDERMGYLVGVHAHSLNSDDQDLLQKVADQLAIAIRQADLYTQTQAQVKLLNQALAQLQKAQTQLVQSEKMSSLGQLVAGVAHEINNPVNFIYGNINYAENYVQEILELLSLYQMTYPQATDAIQAKAHEIDLEFMTEDVLRLLTSMRIGAERIREIVKSLRVFSRLDEAEYKEVDIHEGIDSTLMILQSRLKAKSDQCEIEVIKEYGSLPLIECYAGQLNQVFMNILSNAVDALEEQRSHYATSFLTGTNSSNSVLVTEKPTIWIRTGVEGEKISIHIIDNGPGISEVVQRSLFDPFFTTKPVGQGTGLGLAISYEIVTQKHRGALRCESNGKGTEFIIQIPIHSSSTIS